MDYNDRLKRRNGIDVGTHMRRVYTGRATARNTGYSWAGCTRFFMSTVGAWIDDNLEPEQWKNVRITSRVVLAERCAVCDGWGSFQEDKPDQIPSEVWTLYSPTKYCHHCNGEGVAYVGEID